MVTHHMSLAGKFEVKRSNAKITRPQDHIIVKWEMHHSYLTNAVGHTTL